MKYIVGLIVSIVIVGCAPSEMSLKVEHQLSKDKIYDLEIFPQKVEPYLSNIQITGIETTQEEYEKKYFRVWNNIPSDSKEIAMWAFNAYSVKDSYGENLQPLGENFFVEMRINSNFDEYKTINKNALTLRHLDIRAFPTSQPLLHNPKLAGEGFPFDYMQNSTVAANKPVFISHYSRDKEWAYIFTSFTAGWVKTNDIVIVSDKYTDIWQKAQQIFLIKDGVGIYDEQGRFLFKSRIGMMLALVDEDEKNYTVLTISSFKGDKPLYLRSKISKEIAHKGLMEYNNQNIIKVLNEIAKSKYGWGGIYNQRDCSSTLRDYFAPFGMWLPRNSFQQAKLGEIINLDGFSDENKIKQIKEKAIAFKTLLFKQGHILLYVGVYNNTVVAFHNIWGIRTKKDEIEGRIIIGKAVFSSLRLGSKQKYFDKDAQILTAIKSMNIISK